MATFKKTAAATNLRMTQALYDLSELRPSLDITSAEHALKSAEIEVNPTDIRHLPTEILARIVGEVVALEDSDKKATQMSRLLKRSADSNDGSIESNAARAILPLFHARDSVLLTSKLFYKVGIKQYKTPMTITFAVVKDRIIQTHYFDDTPVGSPIDPYKMLTDQDPFRFDTVTEEDDLVCELTDPVGPIAKLEECLSTEAGQPIMPQLIKANLVIDLRDPDMDLSRRLKSLFLAVAAAPKIVIEHLDVFLIFEDEINISWLVLILRACEMVKGVKHATVTMQGPEDILDGDTFIFRILKTYLVDALMNPCPTVDTFIDVQAELREVRRTANIMACRLFINESPINFDFDHLVDDHIELFFTAKYGFTHPCAITAYQCRLVSTVVPNKTLPAAWGPPPAIADRSPAVASTD